MLLRLDITVQNARTLTFVLRVIKKRDILIEWRNLEICLVQESPRLGEDLREEMDSEEDLEMQSLLLQNQEDSQFKDAFSLWSMPVNVEMPIVVFLRVIR
jgi:hypothetical protein